MGLAMTAPRPSRHGAFLFLDRPRAALIRWPPDAHLVLALALAVPVWAALGLLAGPHMYLPSGWTGWLSFALAYPLVEELLFRGILQGELLRLTTREAMCRAPARPRWPGARLEGPEPRLAGARRRQAPHCDTWARAGGAVRELSPGVRRIEAVHR
jgi:hypothetical protein